jgi:ABC-type multidrug transport system ATPase subunit
MDAICCEGLTKRYRDTLAVDALSLAVPAGLVYGFLGPNGAGKTTTIRMLLGLVRPTAGRVWVLGRQLPDPAAVARCGALFEEAGFYPWMTGRANLQVASLSGGCRDNGRVRELLDRVDLGPVADRRVKTYSQGMRQRLGLAAALLNHPPLVVLDEPTNGLDPAGIRDVRDLLRRLADDGTTVFLSSHLLAEVEQVCDRAAVVVAGRLVEEAPISQLGATRRRVRIVVGADDAPAVTSLLSRWPVTGTGSVFIVDHPSGRDVNEALAAGGIFAESVIVEHPGLEERFLELTHQENPHVAVDR